MNKGAEEISDYPYEENEDKNTVVISLKKKKIRDTSNNQVLYIIMRTDMESMNPGKGMAQAAHAANAAVEAIKNLILWYTNPIDPALLTPYEKANPNHINIDKLMSQFTRWEQSTAQGFGTCVVLGATLEQLKHAINDAQEAGLVAELVRDPSYPLMDGDVLHLLDIVTCGYIFVGDRRNTDMDVITGSLRLHP